MLQELLGLFLSEQTKLRSTPIWTNPRLAQSTLVCRIVPSTAVKLSMLDILCRCLFYLHQDSYHPTVESYDENCDSTWKQKDVIMNIDKKPGNPGSKADRSKLEVRHGTRERVGADKTNAFSRPPHHP